MLQLQCFHFLPYNIVRLGFDLKCTTHKLLYLFKFKARVFIFAYLTCLLRFVVCLGFF